MNGKIGKAARSAVLLAVVIVGTVAKLSAQIFSEVPIPTASSQCYGIVAGPDGNMWFVETGWGKIGHTSLNGIVEITLPANGFLAAITAGPDGNVWFTERDANTIGRMTPDGLFAEFHLPPSSSKPQGIAVGPDGALWFGESGATEIGRITTAGAIAVFPLPAGSHAFQIVAGSDGSLWFTDSLGTKIGRMTTAGVVTEFTLPTADGFPFGIAAGPDGAIWFTELIGQIGRITTAGVITEFPIPTAGGGPNLIAQGQDGALWFTEIVGNKIGRITVTEYTVPTAASKPYAIAMGPDGAMWFTELIGNNLGRITVPSNPTPVVTGMSSRKVHAGAGTFDLPLSAVPTNPTTEPRQGPAQTIVFKFNKAITSVEVTIDEGIATVGTVTFNGNDVIVPLSNVSNQQYVTVRLDNVVSTDGGTGGTASVRVGFLLGDVNQNRSVSLADLGLVNAQLAKPVTAANYLKDVNASGTLSLADKGITNANLAKALPAP